ncbi:MAG: hypothetical protein JSR72_10160 [Proteobacteria bacterium]|nr:hypothetical protein [Pseudomonadota bacterium]
MKQKARLIIPMWGEVYAQKLITITIPALLAPGNVPAFAEDFDLEFVIVTETRLFETIRAADSFKNISQYCKPLLFPIDDLMTDLPGDYGVVLTYALFRGFIDLGEAMTETNLLFFNTDFIISDGSLRHVAELIKRGERVIHAPSFRVVLEDVWPQLEARVDETSTALAVPAREMAAMALKHKHITVKARTVNQRLCHQWRMDQFYWYVDEHTLIGYQWPVALVAIRPERVILEPTLVWDYGFVPEAAPTLPKHFIDDSDNFFMLEPQKRATGEDLVRLGAISVNDIAKDLSKWTTKEHRDCGQQLLKIHSADLPDISTFVAESKAYLSSIMNRLSPQPQPHINHGLLGEWFDGAKERMRANRDAAETPLADEIEVDDAAITIPHTTPVSRQRGGMVGFALSTMKLAYRYLFGHVPFVRRQHPLWADINVVADKIRGWREKDAKVLWIASHDSLFYRAVSDRVDPAALFFSSPTEALRTPEAYDACLCELSVDDFASYREYYERIRPLMKNGGEVVAFVIRRNERTISNKDLGLCESALPDVDISRIRFFGSLTTGLFRRLFLSAATSFPNRPMMRNLWSALVLVGLAPWVRLGNHVGSKDDSIYHASWTSLALESKVVREQGQAPVQARAS